MQPTHNGPDLTSVAVGLMFAVVVGAAAIPFLKQLVELSAGLDAGDRGKRVPAWLTGLVERVFFSLIVAYDISGAAPGMMAWIGLKMAANWNSAEARLGDGKSEPSDRDILNRRFTALITSALAMGIAMIGGLIGSAKIPINDKFFWTCGTASVVTIIGHFIVKAARNKKTQAPVA
jgi:hypothetical protein